MITKFKLFENNSELAKTMINTLGGDIDFNESNIDDFKILVDFTDVDELNNLILKDKPFFHAIISYYVGIKTRYTTALKMIKILLDKDGIDINKLDDEGNNILNHLAQYFYYNDKSLSIYDLIIGTGVSWNIKNNKGQDFVDMVVDTYRSKPEKELEERYPDEYAEYLKHKKASDFNL